MYSTLSPTSSGSSGSSGRPTPPRPTISNWVPGNGSRNNK
jgi:hypothetical protein